MRDRKYLLCNFMAGARHMNLTLGERYLVGNRTAKVIQVTKKGINLVFEDTHKTVSPKRHLYAQGYGGKPFERDKKTFKVLVPAWLVPLLQNKIKEHKQEAG